MYFFEAPIEIDKENIVFVKDKNVNSNDGLKDTF